MSRAQKQAEEAGQLRPQNAGIRLDPMRFPRYRLRTWLRANLPYAISDRIPKGPDDCGRHVWYRQNDALDACYHCVVGERPHEDPSPADPGTRRPVPA